jgi:hypothetical protein
MSTPASPAPAATASAASAAAAAAANNANSGKKAVHVKVSPLSSIDRRFRIIVLAKGFRYARDIGITARSWDPKQQQKVSLGHRGHPALPLPLFFTRDRTTSEPSFHSFQSRLSTQYGIQYDRPFISFVACLANNCMIRLPSEL